MKKTVSTTPKMTTEDWIQEVVKCHKDILEARDESIRHLKETQEARLEVLSLRSEIQDLKKALWDSFQTQAQMVNFLSDRDLEVDFTHYREETEGNNHIKELGRRFYLDRLLSLTPKKSS